MYSEEKTLSSEMKFDGRVVKLFVDDVELDDGTKTRDASWISGSRRSPGVGNGNPL